MNPGIVYCIAYSTLSGFGLGEATQQVGQRQQQEGCGELQERGPRTRARRGLLGARFLGHGVGELGRDGGHVDLADAVLPHHLLGGVAVSDVLVVVGRVPACWGRRCSRMQ
jgi:hypothetical protein